MGVVPTPGQRTWLSLTKGVRQDFWMYVQNEEMQNHQHVEKTAKTMADSSF